MWPAYRNAFEGISLVNCPNGENCGLPNCPFYHEDTAEAAGQAAARRVSANSEPPAKRQKLDDEGASRPAVNVEEVAEPHVFVGSIVSNPADKDEEAQPVQHASTTNGKSDATLPRTVTKSVSPPPKKTAGAAPPSKEANVPLMPRKMPNEPAGWARRLAMLKLLHQYTSPLNEKLKRAVKPEIQALYLNENQLNKLTVDEEQRIARDHHPVYENVLKQRLVALKKMSLEDWVKDRRAAMTEEPPKKAAPKKIVTGLTPKEEVIYLSTLLASEQAQKIHGVVTKVPTDAELAETRAAQVLADFWEVCDRCGTRFQVFPDRREEDGALTTGGKCQHHYGKKSYSKAQQGQPKEPPHMTCCKEVIGSPGCITMDTHVFKISDPNRMSHSMPFIETPENDQVEPFTAVCFDCEMGYTTHGLELLRLTAVAWPSHKPLVDVLVRPIGHVLDLNTRFSGVTPEQFLNAKPYDPDNPKPKRLDLCIVTPQKARELFLEHVSPKTPVLGHAIENDLNALRLVHPTIVDTVILFPTRNGFPYRHGLRNLAKWHLKMDIQQGGAAGHDSYEDAKTTGELVRFKIAEDWKEKQKGRWFITDDGVYPPIPLGPAPSTSSPP
ncbi:hypothetical protein CC80DRAFT_363584, partial [Byssothecium circinans]